MKSCVASQLWVGGWLENVIRDIQKMQKELFCIPLCLQKYFSQFVACLWPLLAELKKTIPPFGSQPPKPEPARFGLGNKKIDTSGSLRRLLTVPFLFLKQ